MHAPIHTQDSNQLMELLELGVMGSKSPHNQKTSSFICLHFGLWMLDHIPHVTVAGSEHRGMVQSETLVACEVTTSWAPSLFT